MDETAMIAQLDDGGWCAMPLHDNYSRLIGPFLQRADGSGGRYALRIDERHRNRNGKAHGGVILSLADKAVGMTARHGREDWLMATVQLNHQFIKGVEIGAFLEARCEVVQTNKTLIFVNALLLVGDQTVGNASGVFSHRGESGKAGR
ncbi:MAG: PaaI family thioesterase [Flavobacteriaceae bacterium]